MTDPSVWSRSKALAAVRSLNLTGDSLRVAQYWLGLWTGEQAPKRSDFDPGRFRDILSGIAIFEVNPRRSVRCRIAGERFTERFGVDISGRDWLQMTPLDLRPVRLERNSTIVNGCVSLCHRSELNSLGHSRWFSDVQFPFGDVAEDGSRTYLHYSEWRPSREDRLQVAKARVPVPAVKFIALPIG